MAFFGQWEPILFKFYQPGRIKPGMLALAKLKRAHAATIAF